MIAHGKKYHDIRVSLDGATFVGCTFERCTFVYSGVLPVQLDGNTIINCEWELAGPGGQVVGFLTAIYAQGGDGAATVEKLFAQIRANAGGQRRAGDAIVMN